MIYKMLGFFSFLQIALCADQGNMSPSVEQGGHTGSLAYVQLSSSVTQTPTPIVGSLILADTVNTIKNFEISDKKDSVICKVSGLYFLSCSMQPAALKRGIAGYLDCWFELNGKAISDSTTRQYVTEESPVGLMNIPFLIRLNEGDSIGARISASGPDIGIIYVQNPHNEPDITSYIISIFKID